MLGGEEDILDPGLVDDESAAAGADRKDLAVGQVGLDPGGEAPTDALPPGRVEEVVSSAACALSITESTSIKKRTLNAIVRPSPSISAPATTSRPSSGLDTVAPVEKLAV